MTDKTNPPASELFDQALKNYESAMRTGLKIQEDAAKYWGKLLSQAASPQDFQKQVLSLANDVIPVTQKSMQSCLELMEQNSRTSVDLVKKGMEAAQTTTAGETQKKLVEFCEGSLKSLKGNAQAIIDINAKAMDSWIVLVKKATAGVPDAKAERA